LEEAIVQPPARGKGKPPLPPWIIMAATGPDLQRLRRGLAFGGDHGESLYLSRIYTSTEEVPRYGLVGPFMGAPQAAMLMEVLSAWGGRYFLLVGWCGAVDEGLQIGDILLPNAAWIDEGTSRGYGVADDRIKLPTDGLHEKVKTLLEDQARPYHEGAVWTTDAVFRETPAKVNRFQSCGALAVEMEVSACLTVARRNGLDFAAVLVVSDELTGPTWRPGFRDPRFQQACHAVSRMIESLCQTI